MNESFAKQFGGQFEIKLGGLVFEQTSPKGYRCNAFKIRRWDWPQWKHFQSQVYNTEIEDKHVAFTKRLFVLNMVTPYMVYMYHQYVKHDLRRKNVLTLKQYQGIVQQFRALLDRKTSDMSCEEQDNWYYEYKTLKREIAVYYILKNMKSVQKLDQQLMDSYTFNEEEKAIINSIATHPQLKDQIRWHGITFND